MTREELLKADDPVAAHRAYYGQFVDLDVREAVLAVFSPEGLAAAFAENRHFNAPYTPLRKWDVVASWGWTPSLARALADAGDFWSLGTGVCIAKEAARRIVEGED